MISQTQMLTLNPSVLFLEHFGCWLGTFLILFLEPLDFIFANPSVGWLMIHDFLFAQHVGLNSPDFIFAFWGSVAWVPLISFYFSGVQPHLGAPQGDCKCMSHGHYHEYRTFIGWLRRFSGSLPWIRVWMRKAGDSSSKSSRSLRYTGRHRCVLPHNAYQVQRSAAAGLHPAGLGWTYNFGLDLGTGLWLGSPLKTGCNMLGLLRRLAGHFKCFRSCHWIRHVRAAVLHISVIS